MGSTTDLRRVLKQAFVPHVESLGFRVDPADAPTFLRFRRPAVEAVHLLEMQWDKYGKPRFVINFGSCPAEGLRIDGELHAPDKVLVGWLTVNGRLQPKRGLGSGNWFRQDTHLLRRITGSPKLRTAAEVVEELLRLYPEVEKYWQDGTVGPHLRMFER
jgi:hypothetical protein